MVNHKKRNLYYDTENESYYEKNSLMSYFRDKLLSLLNRFSEKLIESTTKHRANTFDVTSPEFERLISEKNPTVLQLAAERLDIYKASENVFDTLLKSGNQLVWATMATHPNIHKFDQKHIDSLIEHPSKAVRVGLLKNLYQHDMITPKIQNKVANRILNSGDKDMSLYKEEMDILSQVERPTKRVIDLISYNGDSTQKYCLARYADLTSPETRFGILNAAFEDISEFGDSTMARAFARRDDLSFKELSALLVIDARTDSNIIKNDLMKNNYMSPNIIKLLTEEIGEAERSGKDLSKESNIIEALSNDTKILLGNDPRISSTMMHELMKTGDPSIQLGLATNKNISQDVALEIASNAERPELHRYISERDNLTPEIITALAKSENYHVRSDVALMPNVPVEVRNDLLNDSRASVREAATRGSLYSLGIKKPIDRNASHKTPVLERVGNTISSFSKNMSPVKPYVTTLPEGRSKQNTPFTEKEKAASSFLAKAETDIKNGDTLSQNEVKKRWGDVSAATLSKGNDKTR